mgnify:CR=1 FL=1
MEIGSGVFDFLQRCIFRIFRVGIWRGQCLLWALFPRGLPWLLSDTLIVDMVEYKYKSVFW